VTSPVCKMPYFVGCVRSLKYALEFVVHIGAQVLLGHIGLGLGLVSD